MQKSPGLGWLFQHLVLFPLPELYQQSEAQLAEQYAQQQQQQQQQQQVKRSFVNVLLLSGACAVQMHERDARLADLAAEHQALQQQHVGEVDALQSALEKARHHARQLEQRCAALRRLSKCRCYVPAELARQPFLQLLRLQQLSASLSCVCRRAMDKQGWSNDITLLRRQATAVDRRLCQMRLKDRLAGEYSDWEAALVSFA